MNPKGLGKYQKNMLNFAKNNPGWHGINKDSWKFFENELPDNDRYIYIIWKNGIQEDWLWNKLSKLCLSNEVLLWKYR